MKGGQHVRRPYVHVRDEPHREMAIARLAERQHGLVTLTQLQFLGLSRSAVAKRAREGRLTRIHRGVYAVGHGRLTLRGHWMAAVLAYGPQAVLSHRSAAALHGIRPDNRPKTDVTLPSRSARSRPRIDVHRSPTDRRLGKPRNAPSLRKRPSPRPPPEPGGLDRGPLHLARRGARARRRDGHAGPAVERPKRGGRAGCSV